jgi:Ca2+-binding EF-hand superfamily protein
MDKKESSESLRAVFDEFDQDGNGVLDTNEIIEVSKKLGVTVTK